MLFFNTTHVEIIVFSFVLGLIFGFLYDIIRISEILLGILSYSGGKTHMPADVMRLVFSGVFDTVFMLFVAVSSSIFVYLVNNGDFRAFMAVSAIAGITAYHFTLGRLVMRTAGTIVSAIRVAIGYVIVIPARFVWRSARRAFSFIYRHTLGRLLRAAAECARGAKDAKYKDQLKTDIRFSDS